MDSKVHTGPAEKEAGALSPVETPEHLEVVQPDDKQPNAATNVAEPSSDSEKGIEAERQRTDWTLKTIVATTALSGLYVGSQIPLYFVGGSLKFVRFSSCPY